MSGHTQEEIRHHVSIYLRVFGALLILTVLTVGVSYLHLPLHAAIAVALIIATVKASLVAAFFMHLAGEKKIILAVLLLAAFFFVFLLTYPSLHAL
ncbi:MAG TPA: cytochrome C oxidase subunit IV family protein [Candidatus Eisenbacteria bacterium]|nr:cytochrome C oxidase subunit IV family protein [Candidatus Eisenbacteria bacterium]